MAKQFAEFTLKKIDTPRFVMSPIELKDYIPFIVKRVYFTSQIKTAQTGGHCHIIEEEFFIMVQGVCTATIDRGNGIEEIALTAPTSGIYVPNFVWHGFKDFSRDAILLALSSTNYTQERNDYLENYDEYLKIRDQKLAENAKL